MGEKEIIDRWISRLRIFARKHTILSVVLATITFIFLLSCILLYANVLLYDYQHLGVAASGIGNTASVTGTFIHYDTNWFLRIAQYGYRSLNDYAFLPLYPLAIRFFKATTGMSYNWSAIIFSWLALCAASVMLYKWFDFEIKKLGKNISPWMPMGLLAIFPTSMYLAMPYTDGLFMLLNVSAIYLYRKEKYLLASILGGLASATRYQGVLLFVLFASDFYLSRPRDYKKLLPAIGACAGLVGYMIFLKIDTGSATHFITAEKEWGRAGGNLLINLLKSFRPIELWFLIVAGAGLRLMWRHIEKPFFIYSLAYILLPLSSGTFTGFNRYLFNLAPLFLVFAIANKKDISRPIRTVYILSSALLAGWFMLFFANNYLVG